MNCKTCAYPLWNLATRQCPECGAAFKPSDFDFALNAVRFCCPHCRQAYYGDGERGHLRPVEFDCVQCGRHIHMDETVLLPTEGVEEHRTRGRENPWLDAHRGRGHRRWLRTVGMGMVGPGDLLAATRPESSLWRAARFWVVTNLAIWMVAAAPLLIMVVVSLVMFVTGRGGRNSEIVVFVVLALVGVVGTLAASLVFALLAHAILAMTGGTQHGLRRTFQAMAYTSGANAMTALPCFGWWIGWIWWVISGVVALRAAHGVAAWRAVVAVVTPVLLALVLVVGSYAWVIYRGLSAATVSGGVTFNQFTPIGMSGPTPAFQATAQAGTAERVLEALMEVRARDGAWPAHAAELVLDRGLGAHHLTGGAAIPPWSNTTLRAVQVGRHAIGEVGRMTPEAEEEAVEQAATQQGAGRLAYRLGDYVFCYDLRMDPGEHAARWVLIASPHPVVNTTPPDGYTVGRADGTMVWFSAADFAGALEAENQARAEEGFEAIPDPASVR